MRVAQERLEQGVQDAHGLLAAMAHQVVALAAVVADPRADDRGERGQRLELLTAGLAEDLHHDRALDIEAALAGAPREQGAGGRIGEGIDRLRRLAAIRATAAPRGRRPRERTRRRVAGQARRAPEVGAHAGAGGVDHGQAALAEHVQLDQARRLDGVHVPLRDRQALRAHLKRHEVGNRPRRDDDAAGVRAQVLGQLIQARGKREQARPVVPRQIEVAALGVLGELLAQRGAAAPVRQQLDARVPDVVVEAERGHEAAKGAAGAKGLVGADHRRGLAAVAAEGVVEDLVAGRRAEVDVEVRQPRALEVEEALEVEAILQRIHVRDAEREGHQAAGRAAAAQTRQPVTAPVAHQIPGDEEVGRDLAAPDHVQLAAQGGQRAAGARVAVAGREAEALAQALVGEAIEEGVRVAGPAVRAGRQVEARRPRPAEGDAHLAVRRDLGAHGEGPLQARVGEDVRPAPGGEAERGAQGGLVHQPGAGGRGGVRG